MKSKLILALVAALGLASPAQAASGGLQFSLDARQAGFSAKERVVVQLTVSNPGKDAGSLAAWQAPELDLDDALFAVTRDGKPVDYVGPFVKRSAADKSNTLRLDGGAKIVREIDLSDAYDFSQTGEYAIAYAVQGASKGETFTSNAITLRIDGRARNEKSPERTASLVPQLNSSVAFSGRCSATQQSTILSAVAAASTYANGANTYLGGISSGTQRYTTWFGAFTTARGNTAKTHFSAIKDAFDNKPIVVDCKCRKSYYAYVYPNQPYKIYVCNAFWSAPMTGTDSKAGTLIHEMSHFTVVAGTDDWAYGQTAAKSLASSDPAKALDNADSHEYFAENTPAQP
ncbi:MAG TPA: M35 family metallo-endopeptidase [Thermoflexales bacterium]|nr:M35 family metallo-endopeptidase [Thermoflexales bacterium]